MVSIAGGKLALPYKRNNDMYQKLRIFALKKTKEKKTKQWTHLCGRRKLYGFSRHAGSWELTCVGRKTNDYDSAIWHVRGWFTLNDLVMLTWLLLWTGLLGRLLKHAADDRR